MPGPLHKEVQAAFLSLHKHGCLFRDLVRVQGKDVLTPVSRILIGNPGCTYKYLNTRLFTVPWPVKGSTTKYHEAEIAAACQTFLKLNDHLQAETVQAWEELVAREKADVDAVPVCIGPDFPRIGMGAFDAQDEADIKNRSAYNVTLLNFMDPQKMPYLKEEPYFGMGKMAVSWHHDESLVERSAVAVYSHSFEGTVRPLGAAAAPRPPPKATRPARAVRVRLRVCLCPCARVSRVPVGCATAASLHNVPVSRRAVRRPLWSRASALSLCPSRARVSGSSVALLQSAAWMAQSPEGTRWCRVRRIVPGSLRRAVPASPDCCVMIGSDRPVGCALALGAVRRDRGASLRAAGGWLVSPEAGSAAAPRGLRALRPHRVAVADRSSAALESDPFGTAVPGYLS